MSVPRTAEMCPQGTFPTIGTFQRCFSNHWNFFGRFFQPLELFKKHRPSNKASMVGITREPDETAFQQNLLSRVDPGLPVIVLSRFEIGDDAVDAGLVPSVPHVG